MGACGSRQAPAVDPPLRQRRQVRPSPPPRSPPVCFSYTGGLFLSTARIPPPCRVSLLPRLLGRGGADQSFAGVGRSERPAACDLFEWTTGGCWCGHYPKGERQEQKWQRLQKGLRHTPPRKKSPSVILLAFQGPLRHFLSSQRLILPLAALPSTQSPSSHVRACRRASWSARSRKTTAGRYGVRGVWGDSPSAGLESRLSGALTRACLTRRTAARMVGPLPSGAHRDP